MEVSTHAARLDHVAIYQEMDQKFRGGIARVFVDLTL